MKEFIRNRFIRSLATSLPALLLVMQVTPAFAETSALRERNREIDAEISGKTGLTKQIAEQKALKTKLSSTAALTATDGYGDSMNLSCDECSAHCVLTNPLVAKASDERSCVATWIFYTNQRSRYTELFNGLSAEEKVEKNDAKCSASFIKCGRINREKEIVVVDGRIKELNEQIEVLKTEKITNEAKINDAVAACPTCALAEATKPREPKIGDYILGGLQTVMPAVLGGMQMSMWNKGVQGNVAMCQTMVAQYSDIGVPAPSCGGISMGNMGMMGGGMMGMMGMMNGGMMMPMSGMAMSGMMMPMSGMMSPMSGMMMPMSGMIANVVSGMMNPMSGMMMPMSGMMMPMSGMMSPMSGMMMPMSGMIANVVSGMMNPMSGMMMPMSGMMSPMSGMMMPMSGMMSPMSGMMMPMSGAMMNPMSGMMMPMSGAMMNPMNGSMMMPMAGMAASGIQGMFNGYGVPQMGVYMNGFNTQGSAYYQMLQQQQMMSMQQGQEQQQNLMIAQQQMMQSQQRYQQIAQGSMYGGGGGMLVGGMVGSMAGNMAGNMMYSGGMSGGSGF